MLTIETISKILKACVSPMVLFILALTILLVYVFKAGTNYLNIGKIFKDYISIFSDAKKHLWIFWGVPVLLSGALIQVTVLTSELAEHLTVFLSILVSAFFAMLSILISKDCYFLRDEDMPQWIYAKGAKHEKRRRRDGSPYYFSEGSVQFPEPLTKPSRTMLTSESQVGRTSHVVQDQTTGRLRVLTPIECERLNGFPDGWTDTGMPERMRYFCMGNALVIPLVTRIANALTVMIQSEDDTNAPRNCSQ